MQEFPEELPSVSPEAYLNKQSYPIPTTDQNNAWSEVIQAGIVAKELFVAAENNYGQTSVIGHEITIDIQQTIKAGETARRQMWLANLALVDYFIDYTKPDFSGRKPVLGATRGLRRFVREALELHPVLELEDVRQSARIGLFEATARHDPDRGSFAGTVRLAAASRSRRCFKNEGDTIRIKSEDGHKRNSESLSSKRSVAYRTNLEAGYSDSIAEFFEHPDYERTTTVPALQEPDIEGTYMDDGTKRHISPALIALQPVYDLPDITVEEQFNEIEWRSQSEYINRLLSTLDNRSRAIITAHFGLSDSNPQTLEEIGQFHGLTRERVRQIEAKAFGIIRDDKVETTKIKYNKVKCNKPNTSSMLKSEKRLKSLLTPQEPLPDLPRFNMNEQKIKMSHQQWLNIALQHIYAKWYDSLQRGQNISLTQLYEDMNQRSILSALSSKSELINAVNGHGLTTIVQGSLTLEGAETVIEHYRNRNVKKPSYKMVRPSRARPNVI